MECCDSKLLKDVNDCVNVCVLGAMRIPTLLPGVSRIHSLATLAILFFFHNNDLLSICLQNYLPGPDDRSIWLLSAV